MKAAQLSVLAAVLAAAPIMLCPLGFGAGIDKRNEQVRPPAHSTGLGTAWHTTGQKTHEANYIDGRPHGTWTFWYDNGQKTTEIQFRNGKCDGTHTNWHRNGKKAREARFVHDELQGSWTYWDENGDLRHGTYTELYEDGKKKSEKHYVNGKKGGTWTHWFPNGQKQRQESYKSGRQHGTHSVWYRNGQKQFEIHWKDGKKHGKQISWYRNGWEEREGTFMDGRAVEKTSRTRSEGSVPPEQWGVLKARDDIRKGKKRVFHVGKPGSLGKPLIDDRSGLPVEILTGCHVTDDLEAKVRGYNDTMRAAARKTPAPVPREKGAP